MNENEIYICSELFDGKYFQVFAYFLAQQFIDKLYNQPSYHLSNMRKDIDHDLHIDILYK